MIAVLAGLAAAFLILSQASAAEPWAITKLTAAYIVNADGSVDATEDYTLDFGGTGAKTFNRVVPRASAQAKTTAA